MNRGWLSLKPAGALAALLVLLAASACGGRPAPASEPAPAPIVSDGVISLDDGITVRVIDDSPAVFKAELFPEMKDHPEWTALMPNGEAGGVVRTYLVRSGDRIALIDSGWGTARKETAGATARILAENGVTPDMVTDILLTHMDGDHIGGLLQKKKAAYPRAVLHIAKKEHDAWVVRGMDRPKAGIELARRSARAYGKRLRLFEYGETVIPGVVAVEASGHTHGHTVYDIGSGERKITVVGDLLHAGAVQFRHTAACTRYDAHPERAVRAREETLARLHREGRIIAGMHFEAIGYVQPDPQGGWMVK